MVEKLPLFTIDCEDWNHALHVTKRGHSSVGCVQHLLDQLAKHEVKAIFYVLGRFEYEFPGMVETIKDAGHIIGDHGFFHDHKESQQYPRLNPYYRSPYWDTTPMPWPPSGGFFFRALPLEIVKYNLRKSGVFWIHPHDLDESHPRLTNPLLNWKRHVGLKGARAKLDRLLSEVQFGNPALA